MPGPVGHAQTSHNVAPAAFSLRPNARIETAAAGSGAAIGEPRVSMLGVLRLVEAIERAGVSRHESLNAAGIPEEALADSDTGVPSVLLERMVDFAIERSGDPALGLHWAQSVTIHTFGPVSVTLMHSVSLRQVFELVQQYERLFCDHRFFSLTERGDQAFLHLIEWPMRSMTARRFVAEMGAACFATVIRKLHGGRIDGICFSHSAPDHCDEYARVLEMEPSFEQTFTGIVFERAALVRKNPHSDDEVRAALANVLDRRMRRATQDAPYDMRVRELLSQHLPRRLNIQAVARKLGLSERTLRRYLAAEGTSFRDILHGVCAVSAVQMLEDRRLTIQETAHAMGFSNASTFHRAFRRWTGKTPLSFGDRIRECECVWGFSDAVLVSRGSGLGACWQVYQLGARADTLRWATPHVGAETDSKARLPQRRFGRGLPSAGRLNRAAGRRSSRPSLSSSARRALRGRRGTRPAEARHVHGRACLPSPW